MIVANLATYPPREESLLQAVHAIAPQVDLVNIILNEYETVPEALNIPKVNAVIPHKDLKDTGKFYPDCTEADYVFCIDDDIKIPGDFVSKSLNYLRKLGISNVIGAYHGSIYEKPKFNFKRLGKYLRYTEKNIADYRRVFAFYNAQDKPVIVDQVGSGVSFMPASCYPDWSFMQGSEKFVDVRLARWAYHKGITQVTLPRASNWLQPIRHEETIYTDFTKHNPQAVVDEILEFAFNVPNTGEELQLSD